MSLSGQLLRNQTLKPFFRSISAAGGSAVKSHHNDHEFLQANKYLNSWRKPKDPKEAEAKLAFLRREYAKKVKEVRKEYIQEMEMQRIEKMRKDEAKKEAQRIANEERKVAKAAEKKAKAMEREAAQQEFRKTLLKERQGKLEYWRMREKNFSEKKKEKQDLLRRQSSMWIDEKELEKKALEAIVDTIQL
ncbi:stress response protein NST1-like [Lycium ferocissimum]|uniref:stress response protein NST1-like n=1 Tax=Lycium ferocissimum TaxID=112874 RepID=UPI002815C137|nr:stress response protein NST1-like [Lycium ferocissimum]